MQQLKKKKNLRYLEEDINSKIRLLKTSTLFFDCAIILIKVVMYNDKFEN